MITMGSLSNNDAKKNSNFLMQKALARRENFCAPEINLIQAGQTTQRFVPRAPTFSIESPKIKIDRPKICKL
jgi:hypothetical protein